MRPSLALVAVALLAIPDRADKGDIVKSVETRAEPARDAWDLDQDLKRLAEAKAEFRRRLDGRSYTPLLDKDQAPPLDYRLPAKRGGTSE